jgi:hypothetical protein
MHQKRAALSRGVTVANDVFEEERVKLLTPFVSSIHCCKYIFEGRRGGVGTWIPVACSV